MSLGIIPPALWVLIMAAAPVVELRGAIPLAWQMGFNPGEAFFLSVLGNLIPVLPILFLLRIVRNFLEENISFFRSFFRWLDERTHRRSDKVEKYGFVGLILLTAVPLPTTGAWTASLVAILFKLPVWPSFLAIFSGVIIAGLIVMLITFGFLSSLLGVG